MECPACHHELPAKECPECMEKTPLFGRFCCHCGTRLPEAPPADIDGGTDDFSNRVLCSDGNCIGVINAQGVCNECGKPYAGDEKTD